MTNIEDDWENFFHEDSSDEPSDDIQRETDIPLDFEPQCSEIKISTKTKIVYFDTRLDLNDLFWKIRN